MGIRFWIRTENEPEFTLRTQWNFLNQSLKMEDGTKFWFFQDEWGGDMTLYKVVGYTDDEAKNEYNKKKHMKFIKKLASAKNQDIDKFFTTQWERPIPYWDAYRMLALVYMEAKRDYLKSLINSNIQEICLSKDLSMDLSDEIIPPWYEYKDLDEKFINRRTLPRIPGKVVMVDHEGKILNLEK